MPAGPTPPANPVPLTESWAQTPDCRHTKLTSLSVPLLSALLLLKRHERNGNWREAAPLAAPRKFGKKIKNALKNSTGCKLRPGSAPI